MMNRAARWTALLTVGFLWSAACGADEVDPASPLPLSPEAPDASAPDASTPGTSANDADSPDASSPPDAGAPDAEPMPPRAPLGTACESDEECEGGTCYREPWWPHGTCSQIPCSLSSCDQAGGTCVSVSGSQTACLLSCEGGGACRDGHVCASGPADVIQVCEPIVPKVADGEACDHDESCEGGRCIEATDGWPEGHCTTSWCQTRQDCAQPDDGEAVCLRTRGAAFCARHCTERADCRAGYTCELISSRDGVCWPDSTLPIEVDPATYPIPITCGAPVAGNHRADFEVGADASAYMLTLFARDGHPLDPMLSTLPSGATIDFRGTNAFQTINRTFPGGVLPLVTPAAPQFAAQLESGAHSIAMGSDSAEVCHYLLEEQADGTEIDLNLYFVGVNTIDAASAPTDPGVQRILTRFNEIYAPTGVRTGTIRYFDAPREVADRYATLFSQADAAALMTTSVLPGPSIDDALSLNVFFVRDFAFGGGTLGLSQGIPGPAGLHGTPASGVVFTSEYMNRTFPTGGSRIDGNDYTAIIFAHEIGHYLGLFHTTEISNVRADVLTDTPNCFGLRLPDDCPDGANLMFPLAGIDRTALSPNQAHVVRVNPLTKEGTP